MTGSPLTPEQQEIYAILDQAAEKIAQLERQAEALPKDKGYTPKPAGPGGLLPSGAERDPAFHKAGLNQQIEAVKQEASVRVDGLLKGVNKEERDALLRDVQQRYRPETVETRRQKGIDAAQDRALSLRNRDRGTEKEAVTATGNETVQKSESSPLQMQTRFTQQLHHQHDAVPDRSEAAPTPKMTGKESTASSEPARTRFSAYLENREDITRQDVQPESGKQVPE